MSKEKQNEQREISAKPLFIVNKVNQTDHDKMYFREQCQTEYNQLVKVLTDYHVLYFVEETPNENWANINNYDVRYPNKIPDIQMLELLEMVEQNLSVDKLIAEITKNDKFPKNDK